MFNYTGKILLVLSVLVFGGLTVASAQMGSDTAVNIKVPHSFVLGDKTYPAGEYSLRAVEGAGDGPGMLELRDYDAKTAAFFETFGITAKDAPKNTEFVFDKVGDEYFLSKIWINGETTGYAVEKTKLEKAFITGNAESSDDGAAVVPIANY